VFAALSLVLVPIIGLVFMPEREVIMEDPTAALPILVRSLATKRPFSTARASSTF